MKSIYGSKLFKTSNRKERIKAAMLAQSNLELMQQLAEDLDDEYQTPENLGSEEQKSEDKSEGANEFDDFIVDEDIDPEKDLVTMEDIKTPKSSRPTSPKPSKPSNSTPEDKSEPKSDTSNLMPESPANEEPDKAEASTSVELKEDIKASLTDKLNSLKDTLNSRQDTAGVIRIAQKEKELWIYYNDDINLNDIMVDVIESVSSIDFSMFEFNRLARSDNAIVFVISPQTTPEPEIVDSEEEKKIAEEEVIEVKE